MRLQVIIVSLLLLAGGACSYLKVRGFVGHPVTLPCTYAVDGGLTSICWGRGVCPTFKCSDTLIMTDGYNVAYRSQSRYQLKGQVLQGNVSLTIDNLTLSDAGMYCCRVQVSGLFNDLKYTYSLQVTPYAPPTTTTSASTTPPPIPKIITTPGATTPSPASTAGTPSATLQETGAPSTTDLPLSSFTPTDGNDTAPACSDGPRSTGLPIWKHRATDKLGIPTAIAIAASVLLVILSVLLAKICIQRKMRTESLSFVAYRISKCGKVQKAAEARPRAVENIYVIEDNLYATN